MQTPREGAAVDAAALPPDLRSLIEQVFERLGAGAGRWRLELDAENGRFRGGKRTQTMTAQTLHQFER